MSSKNKTAGGIRCPECGGRERQVLCTRRPRNGIYRRCVCKSCEARYTTYESIPLELSRATEDELFMLAYESKLIDQIRLAAAVQPDKANLDYVVAAANAAVIEFGRSVLQRWGL